MFYNVLVYMYVDTMKRCMYDYLFMIYYGNTGTGVVTSVPSDAPDDYAALRDIQRKKVYMYIHNYVHVSHTHTHTHT